MVELPTIEALRCYDVLLIAAVVFAVDIVMKLWSGRGTQLSPAEKTLMVEYNAQVRLVKRLNSVETFVEQAKATRKMNDLHKKMQELAVERLAASAPSAFQKQLDRIRTPLLMGLLMVYYWSEPLVELPQSYMMPVARLMAMPGFPLGSISAVGWATICRRASAKLSG